MSTNKLNTEKAFDKVVEESKKELESMNALELMKKSGEFQKQIMCLVDSLHLPRSIVLGILMSEVYRLCNETDEFKYLSAFELFKKYVDETFMKKE